MFVTALSYQPAIFAVLTIYFLSFLISQKPIMPDKKILFYKYFLPLMLSLVISYALSSYFSKLTGRSGRTLFGSFPSHLKYFWNYDLQTSLNILNPFGTQKIFDLLICSLCITSILVAANKNFSRTLSSLFCTTFSAWGLCFITQEFASHRSLTSGQFVFGILAINGFDVIDNHFQLKLSSFTNILLIVLLSVHTFDLLVRDFYIPNLNELKIVEKNLSPKICEQLNYVVPSYANLPSILGKVSYEYGASTTVSSWGALGITQQVCRKIHSKTGSDLWVVYQNAPMETQSVINYSSIFNY
jgi:hypothetical protein